MDEGTTMINKRNIQDKVSLTEREPNKLTVYGCGGTGSNIVREFFNLNTKDNSIFSDIIPVVLDASDSDFTTDIPDEYMYIVKDESGKQLEGAGKIRATNYDHIKQSVKDMLVKYPPTNFNIVVHSNSGGSGSVIGPSIVNELMLRGEQVIVLMVGSVSSQLEILNNVRTIKSYENISTNILNKPIISVYMENSEQTPKNMVDYNLRTLISTIAIMASGKNKKLDKTDISNFLNWTSFVSFKPCLTHLELHGNNIVIPENETLIGVLTLTDEDRSHEISTPKYYQAVGIIPDNGLDNVKKDLPLHFCTVIGHYNGIVERMNKLLSKFKTSEEATIRRGVLTDNDAKSATDNGIIL